MKKKNKKIVIVNEWEFNGVDLLNIIEWLVWLGFEVSVKGALDSVEEGGGYV